MSSCAANRQGLRPLQKKELTRQQQKIAESLRRSTAAEKNKWRADVEKLYQEGEEHYRNHNYPAAKMKFAAVESLSPGYKNARFLAAGLKDKIASELKKMDEKSQSPAEPPAPPAAVAPEPRASAVTEQPREQKVRDEKKEEARKEKEQKARGNAIAKSKVRDADKLYRDAVKAQQTKDFDAAKEKFQAYEELLNNNELPADYVAKMRLKIDGDQSRMAQEIEKERERKEDIARRREENFKRQKVVMADEREKSIAELQQKIKMEEERLSQEKSRQWDKPAKQVKVQAPPNNREQRQIAAVEAPPIKVGPAKLTRADVQKELKSNLEKLYRKAEALYAKGQADQARPLFEQIHDLSAGYKDTENYLKRLNKKENVKPAPPAVKAAAPAAKPVKKSVAAKKAAPAAKVLNQKKKSDKLMVEKKEKKSRANLIAQTLDSMEEATK